MSSFPSVDISNVFNTNDFNVGSGELTLEEADARYIKINSNAILLSLSTSTLIATTVAGTLSTASQPNITSLGTLLDLNVSGNISGTLTTSAQPNITSLGTLTSLNLSGPLIADTLSATTLTGTLSTPAQPNITSLGTLTSLNLSGAISGITTLTATTLTGTLSTPTQSNITSLGTLTNLNVNGTSDIGDLVGTTGRIRFVASGGIMYVQSGIAGGGGSTVDLIFSDMAESPSTSSKCVMLKAEGNVGIGMTSPVKKLEVNSITGDCLRLSYSDNATGDINLGSSTNIVDFNVSSSGDLTITPSGNDTTITGNLVATLSTPAQPNITSLGTLTSLNLSGAISGITTLTATTLTGTLSTPAQPNITSLGTLTSLNLSGAISGITTLTATTLTGTLSTPAQPNITSLGTLTSLNLSGPLIADTLSATTLTGTLSTASQPNITSLGTLTSLNTNGTSNLGDLSGVNGRIRFTASSGIMYIQSGTTEIGGSSVDLFFGNILNSNTSSARKLIYKADGKFGIGTITPDKQCEINSSTGDCLRLTYNDNNGGALNYADFNVSSGGDLTIIPSGNTTSITGDLLTYGIGEFGDLVGTTGRIRFVASGGIMYVQSGIAGGGGSAVDLIFSDMAENPSTSSKCVMFKAEGNVGIGMTSPVKKLEVNSITGDCLRLSYSDNATGNINLGSSTNIVDFNVSSSGDLTITPSGGDINLSGNLGIGTTSPAKQCEINDILGSCLRLTYNDSSTNKVDFDVSSDGQLRISSGVNFTDTYTQYNFQKTTSIILSAQTTTKFYPIVISKNILGLYGNYPVINFQILGLNLGEDLYNDNTIIGYARGAGDSYKKSVYHINLLKYNDAESRYLGIYGGTTNFFDGFVIYVRGGYDYTIQTDSDAEVRYNIGGITANSSVFPVKNVSGVDQEGAVSTNIIQYQSLLVNSGVYSSNDTLMMGNVGIGTTSPDKALEINSSTGNCLRLTYNDSDGGATNYADISVSSFGSLNLTPSAVGVFVESSLFVDNTSTVAFIIRKNNAGGDVFVVDTTNTEVGVNCAPSTTFHIKQTSNDQIGGMRLEKNGSSNAWSIFTSTGDGLDFSYNGIVRGFLDSATSVSNIDFTGQHRNKTNNIDINNNVSIYVGLIVSSTGIYENINDGLLDINEALPLVDLSNIDKDKKVWGVISNKEDDGDRTYSTGSFVSVIDKVEGDERLIINSLGEGMIYVCDKNGNLENGDYITTSSAVGYGQLQNEDSLKNYTVGKITQDCDFSYPDRYIDLLGNIISEADFDPEYGYKCKLVGCTYHCG